VRLYDHIEQEIAAYDAQMLKEIEALQPPERRDEPIPPLADAPRSKQRKGSGKQVRTNLWRFAGADLLRIDGISEGVAQIVLTEVGTNLSAFPSEDHFVSWLRLCPRIPISGGKPLKKRRNGTGANRVAAALRMAATTLRRSKSALGASYRRMARRKGAAVAVFATARQLAKIVYRMLRYGHDYVDMGGEAYERQFEQRRIAALEQAARSLGFTLVAQTPVPQPAAG